jgi:hypothetical protein
MIGFGGLNFYFYFIFSELNNFKCVIRFAKLVREFYRANRNDRKGSLFSMFSKIGLCIVVDLKNFFFQANRIAGFDGLNIYFLSYR